MCCIGYIQHLNVSGLDQHTLMEHVWEQNSNACSQCTYTVVVIVYLKESTIILFH